MSAPANLFKARLKNDETVIGCWLSFADGPAAEAMGTAGFDWLVIDGEHSVNDIRSIRDQLIALDSSPSHPIVRIPIGEAWMIKQVLDAGAQTVLVPMVESAAQARELVRACRYPPEGIRGAGAAGARASRFSAIPRYMETANDQICLIVQVESRAGLEALDEIVAVEGVDCVFIGPSDLSADLGYPGKTNAPEVQTVILDMIQRIAAAGKTPGVMALDDASIQTYLDGGARFLAVGIDILVLIQNARKLAERWKR